MSWFSNIGVSIALLVSVIFGNVGRHFAASNTSPSPTTSNASAQQLQRNQQPDCHLGSPIVDLSGEPTLATRTVNHVYAHRMDGGLESNNECGSYTLFGADPSTFVALNMYYGKDKKAVWFIADPTDEGAPVSYQIFGADPDTFNLIPDQYLGTVSDWYARDATRVYWLGEVVPGADPRTFLIVDPQGSGTWCPFADAKDATMVYYHGQNFSERCASYGYSPG